MRLLALALFFICFELSAENQAKSDCDSINLQSIWRCVEGRYSESDNTLNDLYRNILSSMDGYLREDLINVQRKWIAFKESYCTNVFKGIHPGREADIERMICLDSFTKNRIIELNRLTGHDNGFDRLLSKFQTAGLDRAKVIPLFGDFPVTVVRSEEWNDYAESNCLFFEKINGEAADVCKARLNYTQSYY